MGKEGQSPEGSPGPEGGEQERGWTRRTARRGGAEGRVRVPPPFVLGALGSVKLGRGGVKTDGRRASVRGLVVAATNNREGAEVGGQRNHTPAEERGVRTRRGRAGPRGAL